MLFLDIGFSESYLRLPTVKEGEYRAGAIATLG